MLASEPRVPSPSARVHPPEQVAKLLGSGARPPTPTIMCTPPLHVARCACLLISPVCRCESRFCLWQATGPEATTPPAWSEGARLPRTQGRLAPGGHRARARLRALRIRPPHSHALRAATTPRAAAEYRAAVPGRRRAGPRPAAARPSWDEPPP
jgi:hypothetical protein